MLKNNLILRALKSHKKAAFLIIASIVVVITTYSLVLPAFTLEKEKAEQQGGIDTENVSQNLSTKADNSENNDLAGADADSTGFEVKKTAKKEQNSSSDEEEKAENGKSEEKTSDDKEKDPGSSESAAKDEKDDDRTSGENLVLECEEKGVKTTLNYSDGSEIPEGTELAVNEITKKDKEYKRFISEAESAVDEANDSKHQKVISTIKLYDISLSLNGEEIEPEGDVNVSMDFEKGIKAGKDGDVRIIHFTEDEKGELKSEILEDKDVENEIKKDKLVGTEFTTDSFSVYGVVYTVDFSYEVDGKKYEFSMPGGSFVNLSSLIEAMGIVSHEDKELDLSDDESGLELAGTKVSEETSNFVKDIEKVEFSDPKLMWVGQAEEDTTVNDLRKKYDLDTEYSKSLSPEDIDAINGTEINKGDWVLLGIKSFDTEEALTITMSTGEVFTIKVTDPHDAPTVPGNDQLVQTIPNPSGTTIDMFDYWIDRETEVGRRGWLGYSRNGTTGTDSEFWNFFDDQNTDTNGNNVGINHNHKLKFVPSMGGQVIDYSTNGGGTITGPYPNYNGNNTNHPNEKTIDGTIGGINSWNGWNDGSNHYNGIPTQGIIADALYDANGQVDANGYPRLDIGNGAENNESLDYLFNTGTNHAGKKSYGGANNLFYVDPDGYYTYDSMFYRATMDKNTKLFTVQDHNPDDNRNGIKGFWPMGDLNYWLGMHMKTEFSVPANGEVLNPKGVYKPMQFEFSGDDDAWAYIDGILVADGGGVHNRTELDINFKTGVVKVIGGIYTDLTNPDMTVLSERTLYQIFSEAHNNGLITDEKWNSYHWVDANGDGTPDTFEQGTNLTFDFFYLERGGGESNLYIHYNLISTTDFSAHKSYHMLQNDPHARLERDQFKFELIGFDGDSSYEGDTRYAVMPDKGTPSGDGTFASPYKEHSDSSPGGAGVPAGMTAHTKMIIGVTEDGNVNFGDVEISPAYEGKQYKYMVREVVPADAVNADGIRWDAANDELKSEGGFVKDGITYDGRVYYFIGTVVEDPDRIGFYKLKKTRYTDSTYTTEDKETKFFSFVNGHVEPLTLKVLKRDETGETPLNGAQFILTRAMKNQDDKWVIRTYQVGDETVEATPRTGTTRQGSLSFDNLTEGHFILEETAAPVGYEKKDPHRWLFTLTKVDEEDEIVLVPTIQGLDDNGNLIGEPRTLTADSQNTVEYEVLNEPKKISLSLKKEWPGIVPEDTTATFQLKRYRTYTKPDEVQMVDVYIRYAGSYQSYANGGCNTGMHIQVPAHAQVRFGYSGFNAGYPGNDNYVYPWLSEYVGGSGGGHREVLVNGRYDTTYTVGTQEVCFWLFANHGNVSPTDSRFRYTLEYVNGTGDRPGPGETVTEKDPSFTAENIKVDLPHDNKWEYQFDEYPVMGTNSTYHVPETYTYFIEETPEVEGYEVVYDRMNGNDIVGSTDSEERTVWNLKEIDVPVNKAWDWSEDDEARVDHWDATFKLEYREVLVSGEPASDAVNSWRVVDGKQLTIHNGDSDDDIKFKDLPMYRRHSNGSIYRIIYAVDEIAYHVFDSGDHLIARWTKDGKETTIGTEYAPDYEQDAGESDQPEDPDDWPEWYTISLTNDVKETSIEETIDLTVQKKWFDAEGQQFDPGDDAYAKFQLRRYVYEEYRDYSKQGVDTTNWVDVTLDLGGGIQKKITVPRGAPVHVSGLAKPGKNVDITFIAPGNTTLEMKLDNSSASKAAVADTPAFNPQSDCTITLDSGSTASIIGGLEGIRLACYDEKQTMRVDESFNVEHDGHIEPAGQVFTLNNSNNWHKDWVELPYIVESKLENNMQTVYVYSYFLEEKESDPENYISTFRNSADEELGGSNIPVDYSTTVIAENVESTDVKVKKVWDDDNDSKHKRPDSLTVTLLQDGVATDKTVTLSEENHWEDIIKDLPKYNNGVLIDYQWLESDLPDGYFLTHVSTSESDGTAITTLTNTLSEYDLKTSYVGVKTWEDFDNQYLTRPHELPVTLFANGQPTEHVATWVEGPEDNQWTYTFTDLPVFDENGDIIKYTVKEDKPSGYEMTDETSRETVGTIGEIIYEDGKDRVTPDNQIVWNLRSIIDLTFIAIKPTAHGDIPVWTSRTPVPAERQALISAIRSGALPGAAGRNIVFYSGECTIPTPHGDVNVTLSGDSLHVILDLGATNISSQFIVGQFNKNNSSEYDPGTTSFTNTLETTKLEGAKMWAIDPGVAHPDPVLKLTRTTTSYDIDGNPHVSGPEVVQVNNNDLQPEWSGDSETSRHFTYDHLPKYSTEGKEYTYSVEEASFTIGSGDDAVVYTAVKNSDGSYTVTADKPDADPYITTQDANVITNKPLRADLEVIKVEENHLESSHHLSGAVFRLTRVDSDGHDVTGQNSYSEEKTVDPETGKADFTGLKPGRYKLEELEAPRGYIIVESPWYFVVDSTAHISLEAQYEMATPSGVENQFYIENRPGEELPSAGGPGTTWIYLLGAILALGSAIMLAARLRAHVAE